MDGHFLVPRVVVIPRFHSTSIKLILFIGPPIPERASYSSKPIRSPTKPPPPITFPPAKPIVPPVSETASSLDDLLSDLNQVAIGSNYSGPPPATADTSQLCSADGPGLIGSLRTGEKTWFQVSGPDLIPSDLSVNVIGPSGPNKTDLNQSGDRVRVEYTPKVAGEYTVEIKVNNCCCCCCFCCFDISYYIYKECFDFLATNFYGP